jgi:hypothetical protein
VKDSKGAKLAYAYFEEEPAPIIGQDASLCWRLQKSYLGSRPLAIQTQTKPGALPGVNSFQFIKSEFSGLSRHF